MTDTTSTNSPAGAAAAEERPWLDASLPVAERVELLLAEMTLEEKAGLLFQTMITMGEDGELAEADPVFGLPSNREYVLEKGMTHFNLLGVAPTAGAIARWHNRLQELAASTRLGIPVTISTDPRHSFTENPGTAMLAGPFSQWPDALGLAATRDAALVERFGDIARQEYTAVGIRVALHPQVDLATEPRWARALQTFGEDAKLSGELGAAYIRGFQNGESFGPGAVSAMVKHFPGGGPQKDGEDPHFAYGREQVYPGGQFELHLKPFEAAFEAGVRQVMPYYGMPVGTEYEEVGFGFNKSVLTGLLRDRYGFDGIVCTDWGLVNDAAIFGQPFPARAWGVEHLTPAERVLKILDAGADQFGGEACPELVVELVGEGRLAEDRLDVSARRLLREKFLLGLFENPYVDAEAADAIVGSAPFRAEGDAAQRASITVLANRDATLPFAPGAKLYVEGIAPEIAVAYGEVVASPAEADVAILRLQAPFEQRETMFENFFHAGSLEFPADVLAHITEVAAAVPTVVDVFLDRPAILGPVVEAAHAVVGNWGAGATALLDVLSGAAPAQGRLPFDIPSSMAAVEASRPDVPFDTAEPLFRFGHGLSL
ncbi:glycoside hydrolase family 3 N-terminal domain-containing protein [Microbacterium sp. QXD-8]|uniref:beta-glucosidase n=1 Tax=Microbacterium psychrotolerans TaxID=3068321 RepID=A0ABU0YY82_9MICO|nr:glycoside hydrolase family 3 N-terminal domain-containing protein [Microbacterium sp. QXD-8]MDQ7876720.1 glycoside hydrolase family 3 N-terminal domain-containing protein [Microbacterium sp. QXD-8]